MSNSNSVKIEVELEKSNEEYNSDDKSDGNLWKWDGSGQLPHNNYEQFGNVLMKKQKKRTHSTEVEVGTKSPKRLRNSKKKSTVIVIADEDEDNSHPVVTVEVERRSECPGRDGGILSKHAQVNLLSHCIFCLRKTAKCSIGKQQSAATVTDNQILKIAPSSHFLSTFNCTWGYLQMKNKSEVEGVDPVSFLEYITGRAKNEQDVTTFLQLPSICSLCAGKLETVDRLFRDLQTQLEVIGTIVQASKCSGKASRRSEQFKSLLKASNLEEQVVAATIDLLDKLDGYSRTDCRDDCDDGTDGDPLSTTGLTPNSGSLAKQGQNESSSLSSVTPELKFAGLLEKTVLPNGLRENENELNFSNVHEEPLTTYSEQESVREDDWSDNDNNNDPDSDYIKSEPDEDFSENGTSSDSDDSFTKSKTRTSTRKHPKSSSSSTTLEDKNTTHKQKVTDDDNSKWRLLQHERAHRGEPQKELRCQVDGCGKTYKRKYDLDLHVSAVHLLEKGHVCDVCGKSYGLPKSLKSHRRLVHGINVTPVTATQLCDLCKTQVPLTDFPEHARAHIGDEYLIKCPNPKCQHIFTSPISLRIHLRERSDGRNLCRESVSNVKEVLDAFTTCQICEHKATRITSLRTHLFREHENATKKFQCPIDGCTKKFSTRQTVALHIATHDTIHNKAQQSCDLCNAKVSSEDVLEHVRAHVGDEYIIKCPNLDCSRVFSQLHSLKYHLKESPAGIHCRKSLSNVQKFFDTFNVCQVCGYKARDTNILRQHLHREHENETKSFACPIDGCSEIFSSRPSVAVHVSHHDISKDFKRLKCSECGKTFDPSEIADHYREAHQSEITIKCTRCTAVLPSRESLVKHMFSHRHGVLLCDMCSDKEIFSNHAKLREHYFFKHQVGTRYTCEHCGFVTLSNRQLRDHKSHQKHGKIHAIGDDTSGDGSNERLNATLQCTICLITFREMSSLQDHNIKEHGAPLHLCELCGETFVTHAKYRKHEIKHNGGPPPRFTCDFAGCGKKFKQKYGLQHHIASGHLGEKPHVCEICGKAYTLAKALKQHRDSIHLGIRIRPFTCETCGESFSNKMILDRHQLIHSGERPFSCLVCNQRFRYKEVLKRHVEAHARKGADFKPNGPMKQIRKRVERKN